MDFDDILDDVLEEFAEEENANPPVPVNLAGSNPENAPAEGDNPPNPDVSSEDYLAAVSRVMQQLEESNDNNQQIAQPGGEGAPEDLMQMLAGLGLGGGAGGDPQEMSELTEMMQQLLQDPEAAMQSMMQAMMSKEMMYGPIKDFATKYEEWIADQKTKDQYTPEQIEEFESQLELVQNIVKAFDNDDEQTAAELFNELTQHRQMPEEFGHVLMSSLMGAEGAEMGIPGMPPMDPNNPLLQPPVDADGNPLGAEELDKAFADLMQMMAGGNNPQAGADAPNFEQMTDEERAAFMQQQMPNCPQQ